MGPCFKSYFYLINLTGQKQYMTELKWIWPVIVSTLSSTNQKQFPDLGSDTSSVWNFLHLFRGCHLAGKQVVTLPNVGSFLNNNNNNNLNLYSLLLKNKLWQATKADMFHHDWNFLQTTLT